MEFHLPDLGEGIVEAEVVEWHVHPGDEVRRGQALLEVMTDKAVIDIPAPFDGAVQELLARSGDVVQVGAAVLTFGNSAEQEGDDKPASATASAAAASSTSERDDAKAVETIPTTPARVRAAPAVRRKARTAGIDLAAIKPTEPGGRVLLRDLESAVKPRNGADLEPGSRVKLRGLRRAIAETMTRSVQTIPQYSLMDECDVTMLVTMRDSLKEPCAAASVKLTYLAFMVRAAVAALKAIPLVNASLDDAAAEIVLHDHYHIGIATATPEGLVVPVIHDADQKDILEIARKIERLTDTARRGEIRPSDVRGGTFTITSIGNIGGLLSTPIIRPGEVAIMGAGKIIRRPVYDDLGQLRPADLLYLSFTFDHRVVDGEVGARFARDVIQRLENPALLLVST